MYIIYINIREGKNLDNSITRVHKKRYNNFITHFYYKVFKITSWKYLVSMTSSKRQ